MAFDGREQGEDQAPPPLVEMFAASDYDVDRSPIRRKPRRNSEQLGNAFEPKIMSGELVAQNGKLIPAEAKR